MQDFARRVLVTVLIVGAVWVAWRIADLLILVFGGLVLSLPLFRSANLLSRWTRLPCHLALAVVALALFGMAVIGLWRFGAEIAGLSSEFTAALWSAAQEVRSTLSRFWLGRALLGELSGIDVGSVLPGGFVSRVTGIASSVLSGLSAMVLLVVAALYFAAHPGLYRRGLEALAPPALRPRWSLLLDDMGRALWGWLRGQLVSMVVIGVLTTGMLWGLGVPMAIPLGVVAFLLEFVPFIGPIAAAVPGLLIASTRGPELMLWVLLGYILIQQAESYLVAPMVFQHEVFLPPILTVTATVAFGLLFGLVGLLFATPLVVVLHAAARRLLRWRDEAAAAG